MFDVTTFLMRWLFLSNLVRDVAEVQTLPFQPYQQPPPLPRHSNQRTIEEAWKDQCIRGILSYPPGYQRTLVMDALRTELVQQLCKRLYKADRILQRRRASSDHPSLHVSSVGGTMDGDPFLDADAEIVEAFEKATSGVDGLEDDHKATLVISNTETKVLPGEEEASPETLDIPTPDEVLEAHRNMRDVRDYLPQLVSSVLRSPHAFDRHVSDPLHRLRQLLLGRCLQDPSWGVELCWLLEAEVGKAWKTLFEHRQQTGRRLIIVLPAEKAAVLAKIGSEKREAFDLLQDSEQATAYGYTVDEPPKPNPQEDCSDEDFVPKNSRLPSSIGLRRCSHFGDTMHFIDRLTQLSSDLRAVPVVQRTAYLQDSLHDMNRRIRRRMVTKGEISLDVEDNRGPHDWPHLSDLTLEDIQYSVHLPLVPQTGQWPNGAKDIVSKQHVMPPSGEVMRVLNIVVPETRLLASRERCPFLVHLEVADTGLEGHDARLYACGSSALGSTVEEAMGLNVASKKSSEHSKNEANPSQIPYEIPPELLDERQAMKRANFVDMKDEITASEMEVSKKVTFPRGGWQSDEEYYPESVNNGLYYASPYDDIRQQEYEELHEQMQSHEDTQRQAVDNGNHRWTSHSIGQDLLDNVFGATWSEKCNEIRASSPYGHLKGWRLASFILKAGEDIRRESLVMQVISKMRGWFEEEIPALHRPFMRPYTIMCVGGDAGLLECLSDAKSIDEVKKQTDGFVSLRDYFERAYMPAAMVPYGSNSLDTITFEMAQDNFLRSLVGYSLVCYILQIKDRHNANILLDREGHIMHIDFGFVLGDTPKMGKVPIFSERAPFKLSAEFWEVLGGWNIKEGGLGVKFCKMFELAFACASAHADEIAALVESTVLVLNSNPRVARAMANGVRSRLRMRGAPESAEQKMFVVDIVNAALTSWGTSTYDWLQKNMNGYQ